jgi:uncharacterized repeat protein (TIGR01451 family)
MKISQRLRALAVLPAFLVGLLPATATAATPAFNSLPNDYPTLQVSRVGGPWQTFINAAASDTLSLLIWEHNSVPGTVAQNVRVRVNLPTTESAAHTVTATISADNAQSITGSVTINTNNQTSLEFIPSSVRLFRNTGGENPILTETTWPAGINPDQVVTTGINLGDQEGCWQYARAVLLQIRVKGKVVEEPKAVLSLKKEVRRTESDQFSNRTTVNAGDRVQYRLTVTNVDGQGVAKNLRLRDILPAGISYVPGTSRVTLPNGQTVNLVDGITADGLVVVPELKPGETVTVTFWAETGKSLTKCAMNKAQASADNAKNMPEDSADVCVVEKPLPTPTPTAPAPTPVPTHPAPPQPTLPKTGAEGIILGSTLLTGLGLSTGRYALMKRKLRRQAQDIDIV